MILLETMLRKAREFAEVMQRGRNQPPDTSRCWYCRGSGRAPEGGDCYMCDKGRIP